MENSTTKGYDKNNIFARILRGEIDCDKLLENDKALAFNDIAPQAPVHVLVIPKSLVRTFDEFMTLEEDSIVDFWSLVSKVIEVKGLSSNGYRLITNAGADANQEVTPFHLHILGGRSLGAKLMRGID